MLDEKFWAKYFKVYDVLNLLIPYQELLTTICDELDIKNGEKILEAGCGTGNLAIKIKERGAEVVGLDNCKEALEIYKKKDPNAKITLADLSKRLPFPDNHFDKIASNNTLYVLTSEERKICLREFNRVLMPDGKVVISNPKQGWSVFAIYIETIDNEVRVNGLFRTIGKIINMILSTIKIFYYNHLIKKEVHYHFFTVDEQKLLLEKAGFVKSYEKSVYTKQAILAGAYKPNL